MSQKVRTSWGWSCAKLKFGWGWGWGWGWGRGWGRGWGLGGVGVDGWVVGDSESKANINSSLVEVEVWVVFISFQWTACNILSTHKFCK